MKDKKFYIIGAGFAGSSIALDIDRHYHGEIIAFLDDDKSKIGTTYSDKPVLGSIVDILPTLDKTATIILAIPSLPHEKQYSLYLLCKELGFNNFIILPTLSQLKSPNLSFSLTREVDASDFLGRDPIVLDMKKTLDYIKNKRVLVTGAGGSIGSELASQLLIGGASRLYILGHGENSIYNIEKELRKLQAEGIGINVKIIPIIGELQDKDYVKFLLGRLKVDAVFHCAAHKHVPLTEQNPVEAIKNNVFSVKNLLDAIKVYPVERLALISTDKAVDPYNVYGCSKTIGEHLILQSQKEGLPCFVVRFGNVLGSRGSIIPLFKEQILNGGPLTVTHPDMHRFFMTIPEAVSLVLLASGIGSKEAIYLLDMGDSIRIWDLACKVAEVYGYSVEKGEMQIVITGIREGEKLAEKLIGKNEEMSQTKYPRLLAIKQKNSLTYNLNDLVEKLESICFFDETKPTDYRNKRKLLHLLKEAFDSLESKIDINEY